MAEIDAVSYFTDGLCTPVTNLDGTAYFTNGLVIPLSEAIVSRGGIGSARIKRNKFLEEAQEEAEFLHLLITFVSTLDED